MRIQEVVKVLIVAALVGSGTVVSAAPASAAETYHLVNLSNETVSPTSMGATGPFVDPGETGTFTATVDGTFMFFGGFGRGENGEPLRMAVTVFPNWLTGGTAICHIVDSHGIRVHPENVDCVANGNTVYIGPPVTWRINLVRDSSSVAFAADRNSTNQYGVVWSDDLTREPGSASPAHFSALFTTIAGAPAHVGFWLGGLYRAINISEGQEPRPRWQDNPFDGRFSDPTIEIVIPPATPR